MRFNKSRSAVLFLAVCATIQSNAQEVKNLVNGVEIKTPGDVIRIQAVSSNIFHIQAAKDPAFFNHKSITVSPIIEETDLAKSTRTGNTLNVTTRQFAASVNAETGKISFNDLAGKPIVLECARAYEPAEVQGDKTFHIRQQWAADANESLYGLGQHQFGLVDIKGYDFDLWQHNTEIAVPFLVSSKGYGIFWDNPSYTRFGDPRDFVAVPSDNLFDKTGAKGGFTATPFTDAAMNNPGQTRVDKTIAVGTTPAPAAGGGARRGGMGEQAFRWEGEVLADVAGVYQFQLYADGGFKMWIDDQLVSDHWRQNWLAWNDIAKVKFDANTKHKIKVEWVKDGGSHCELKWKAPLPNQTDDTSLWSQVGDGIDYYVVYGPSLDQVIAGYRQLTGKAPMMPIWAFGLWQSRQRYETQKASLDVVKGFRDRKIPFDTIVQDWMYWKEDSWGTHQFDPARFPDPDQWVKEIHALNARLMISVWGKFYPTTDNFKAMNDKGYMYPVSTVNDWVGRGYKYSFYDAFNDKAGELFWSQVNERLFSKGMDAWWMDATEPDTQQPSPPVFDKQFDTMPTTAMGKSSKVLNAYPTYNSKAVYEGQRKTAPDQRVFILTRSGYAGQQKYGTASWSGDISSTWTAMKKQIAAGLGYSISGLPYWTMDSGGFSVPNKFNARNAANVDEWRELNTRWFQFCTFVPLLRVHGEVPLREMWEFGGETSDAYKAMLKFDRLRYVMLPYIYSMAGDVTQKDSTFMRPLVMDFPNDKTARTLNDQYLFGKAMMVSPVCEFKARGRSVYLPQGGWYDLWSGKSVDGGQTINADAPYDAIPVHIRAGSIIPMGPELQYTTEKKADPLTLYVYAGADGEFSLYEDDGLTYQYEKDAFSQIPMKWNDASKTLSIGKRTGSFKGMLEKRTIQVVFITKDKPAGFSFTPTIDKTIAYTGEEVQIKP